MNLMKHFCDIRLVFVALLLGGGAHAGSLILNVPATIAGSPGATIGWDFTLTWTSTNEWESVTGSALINETDPLGLFTDWIGPQSGPAPDYGLGPGSPSTTWTESFDLVNSLGLGSYSIDPAAVPFAEDQGQIVVYYDVYDGSPADNGNLLRSESVTAPFDVQVTAPVAAAPEPKSLWLVAAGGLLALALLKRRG